MGSQSTRDIDARGGSPALSVGEGSHITQATEPASQAKSSDFSDLQGMAVFNL